MLPAYVTDSVDFVLLVPHAPHLVAQHVVPARAPPPARAIAVAGGLQNFIRPLQLRAGRIAPRPHGRGRGPTHGCSATARADSPLNGAHAREGETGTSSDKALKLRPVTVAHKEDAQHVKAPRGTSPSSLSKVT